LYDRVEENAVDGPSKLPLVFANRVIRQFADHLLGEDVFLLPEDYRALRLVFRWCQGSWERLELGDIVHNRLLVTIITTWGKKPKKDVEQV
jgi:hypothetical protein